jgi:hypothetical protein
MPSIKMLRIDLAILDQLHPEPAAAASSYTIQVMFINFCSSQNASTAPYIPFKLSIQTDLAFTLRTQTERKHWNWACKLIKMRIQMKHTISEPDFMNTLDLNLNDLRSRCSSTYKASKVSNESSRNKMLQSKLADANHVPRSLERVFGTEGRGEVAQTMDCYSRTWDLA